MLTIDAAAPQLPKSPEPQFSDELAELLSAYVPHSILTSLKVNGTIDNGCMRIVSVVFIKLHGIETIEDCHSQMKAAHDALVELQKAMS